MFLSKFSPGQLRVIDGGIGANRHPPGKLSLQMGHPLSLYSGIQCSGHIRATTWNRQSPRGQHQMNVLGRKARKLRDERQTPQKRYRDRLASI